MSRRRTGRNIHGLLLLDKRLGISSNRALQEVKRLFNANKAGHTGSLDPLATGLLPICFGEATKVSAYLLDNDKRYQVIIQLGVMTDTGDEEGKVLEIKPAPELDEDALANCLEHFTGEIDQLPPMFSALKYQGKKLYQLAREGKTVERKPRRITIYQLMCLGYCNGQLTLDVSCSKGTYIRTLAEDIGRYFGCGGMVKELRRTKVGPFSLNDALTLEQCQQSNAEALLQQLLPVDKPLIAMPSIQVSEQQAVVIRQGQQLSVTGSVTGVVRIYNGQQFLGLGEMLLNGKLAPKKLFNLV